MAPVNFLVQPQDLDEINNKLDIVIALLERWDKDRQEVNKVTLPIRTTNEPSIENDNVMPVKPTQKRKKRPYFTSDDDAPMKRLPKEKKKAPPKRYIHVSESAEEEETAPETEHEFTKEKKVKKTIQDSEEDEPLKTDNVGNVNPLLPEKLKKMKKKLPAQHQNPEPPKLSKTFAQKSDPVDELDNDDDFVIEKI